MVNFLKCSLLNWTVIAHYCIGNAVSTDMHLYFPDNVYCFWCHEDNQSQTILSMCQLSGGTSACLSQINPSQCIAKVEMVSYVR